MEFSRQEYWRGLAFPSPGYLPDSGIEPGSHALQTDSLPPEPSGSSFLLQSNIPLCFCVCVCVFMHVYIHVYMYIYVTPVNCEVTQSCPTLCNPMDCSLPGPSVHGTFQARVLEWVAISFSICDTYICKYPTLSFSTHLSKDTYVASISWLLEIILL